MAEAEVELVRSTATRCLYCNSPELAEGVASAEDFFFRNVPGAFDYRRCADCDSLVLTDPLAAHVLHEAYAEYYTHASPDARSPRQLRDRLRERYLQRRFGGERNPVTGILSRVYEALASDFDTIDRIGRYAPPAPATILDYGCGDGEFLARMAAFGHTVTGVDFDPVCVRKGQEKGIPVFTPEDVPASDWAGRFDFISLAHVIEHVPDPNELLSQLAAWLKPGGRLFLETPNADALGLDIFGKYWRGLEAPRHLSVPSLPGLLASAARAGFTLERQIVGQSLRRYLWEECLSVVPEEEREDLVARMERAAELTPANAEFITLLFAKQG